MIRFGTVMVAASFMMSLSTPAIAFQAGQCDPRCYTPGARHDGSFVCDATCSVPANNAFKGAKGADCAAVTNTLTGIILPATTNASRANNFNGDVYLCVAGKWSFFALAASGPGGSSTNTSEGPGGAGGGEGN